MKHFENLKEEERKEEDEKLVQEKIELDKKTFLMKVSESRDLTDLLSDLTS